MMGKLYYLIGKSSTGKDTILKALLEGKNAKAITAVPGTLCLRQSCGCEPLNYYRKDTIREKYIRTVTNLESLALSNTNLILGGAMDETLEDIYGFEISSETIFTSFLSAIFLSTTTFARLILSPISSSGVITLPTKYSISLSANG